MFAYSLKMLTPYGGATKKPAYPSFDSNKPDVKVEASHVEIQDNNAIFKNGEAVNAIFSLCSFLWMPLGKTPPFVHMQRVPLSSFPELSPHKFHYNVTVDSHSSHVELSIEARAVIAAGDTFFFVDDNGEFMYNLPIRHTCFLPLGTTVPNLRHWKREYTESVPITNGIDGISGSSGVSGSSGSSGSSGTSGKQGLIGPPGIPGIRWQGEWSSEVEYSQNDLVRRFEDLWICLANNQGKPPEENILEWDVLLSTNSSL